ncbi:hypothetical protein ACQKWADRAFT_291142 [Trichoderma austrokoningii]
MEHLPLFFKLRYCLLLRICVPAQARGSSAYLWRSKLGLAGVALLESAACSAGGGLPHPTLHRLAAHAIGNGPKKCCIYPAMTDRCEM